MMNQTEMTREQELRRQAHIAVRQLGFRSLRDYELEMYKKAIEQASRQDQKPKAKS